MTEGADSVWSHPFLWIVTGTVIAINVAAAMAHNTALTFMGLAMTGIAAVLAISIGIWSGLMKTKVRRQS